MSGAASARPYLLDLFCGAGGAGVGYHRAGFDVLGVDIAPQPHYPFEFVQTDALDVLSGVTFLDLPYLDEFSAIHASPPCQHFTAYGRAVKDIKERYEDLLEPTRALLERTGLPYVIENVEGAPLREPLTLCGSMFDLDVRRHHIFESSVALEDHPWPCRHGIWSRRFRPASNRSRKRFTIEIGSWDEPIERQKAAMGVDWPITVRELSEAIPPAYTEFVGTQLLAHIMRRAA